MLNRFVCTFASLLNHRASDTFDKVDSTSFPTGGPVVAATTYALSEHPSRIAAHIGPDAVPQTLRAAKLDVDLVHKLWKP